jgi:Uma2 family endonuclease
MMSVQPKPQMTFGDWLAAERAVLEGRSEYVRGEVFAMTGGSEEHNLILHRTC